MSSQSRRVEEKHDYTNLELISFIQEHANAPTRTSVARTVTAVRITCLFYLCEAINTYIVVEPAWYHRGRRGRYGGDYHPEGYNLGPETDPDLYEADPRTCNNCGERKFCLSPAGIQELSRMF